MSNFFRSVARSRTINSIRAKVRNCPGGAWLFRSLARAMNRDYEERFQRAILGAIRPGDVVWDIGANVGFYTEEFLGLVGENGRVVAVEPTPASADRIRALASSAGERLTVVQAALGSACGTVSFSISSSDPTSVTNAVCGDGDVKVEMLTADELLGRLPGLSPDLLKLDVEGFEIQVLEGMKQNLLKSSKLRSLFIEVHSTLLANQGIDDGGRQIENLLESSGYKVDWVDFSHVVAVRRNR